MKPLVLSLALLTSLLFAVPSRGDTVPVDDFALDDVGLKLFFSLPESPTPDFPPNPIPVHVYTSDGLVTGFRITFFSESGGLGLITGLIMDCSLPSNPALPPNFCDAVGTPGIGFTNQQFFLSAPNGLTFIPGTYISIQGDFQSSLTITREAPETSALTLLACGLAFLLCYRSLARRS